MKLACRDMADYMMSMYCSSKADDSVDTRRSFSIAHQSTHIGLITRKSAYAASMHYESIHIIS